jgi:hypothetical protein
VYGERKRVTLWPVLYFEIKERKELKLLLFILAVPLC